MYKEILVLISTLNSQLRNLQTGNGFIRSTNQLHKLDLSKLINIEDSIDLFRMSSREHQRNCDVDSDKVFDVPAPNTRNKRLVIMTVQVKDKQQQLLNTLLDKNLRTTTRLKGNTRGNTKILDHKNSHQGLIPSKKDNHGLLKMALKSNTYTDSSKLVCQSQLVAILKAMVNFMDNHKHDPQASPEMRQE